MRYIFFSADIIQKAGVINLMKLNTSMNTPVEHYTHSNCEGKNGPINRITNTYHAKSKYYSSKNMRLN